MLLNLLIVILIIYIFVLENINMFLFILIWVIIQQKKMSIHEKQNCPECPECKENNIKQPSEDKSKSAIQKCPDNKQNYINIIRLLTKKINILNDIMTNK